jgi:hypothetical protein
VPAGGLKLKRAKVGIDPRVQLQKRLIYATKLLRAKIPVVDLTLGAVNLDQGEVADGRQQIAISQVAPFNGRH